MSALSDRHEALFSQFFDIQSELASVSELRKIIGNRMEQLRNAAEDAYSKDEMQHALGGLDACRAIMLDIDTIMGRRQS
jgi:hypothetical protein